MTDVTAKFVLNSKNLNAKFDLSEENTVDAIFKIDAAGVPWGSIDGTLSNQTDLQAALDLKADKLTVEADFEALNDTITENYDTLDSKIDSINTSLSSDISTLDTKVNTVKSDLSGDIFALSETVINNNTAINDRVDGIVTSFDSDIEGINTNISNLETVITDNYSDLNGKITTLSGTVDNNYTSVNSRINTLETSINADIVELNTHLSDLSDTVADNYSTLNTKINNTESTLQGEINTLSNTVTSNYNTLDTKIDGINSDLSGDISSLQTTVNSNYTTLNTKIDNTKTELDGDIASLSQTVTDNYTALNSSITSNVSTLNNRIDSEVSTLNTSITNEAATRESADTNLQSQIDALTVASDVVDIVGTYAELQAYDTTNLPVNDIIKVLNDETHDNASSYYKWTGTAWDYIGSEGPYYTKSEADEEFVSQRRTINDKDLSANITLTASDVGALPDTTVIGSGILTIQKNGTAIDTFNANATTNKSINIEVPTAVSELTNDSGYLTSASLDNYALKSDIPTATSDLTNDSGFITNSALTNYALKSEIPEDVSELNNDAGYITISTLSGYATTTDLTNGLATKQNTLVTGANIQINNNVISATDTTYTAGTGINITNGVISNTQTSAEWGNITGTLSSQTDLQNALNAKQDTLVSGTSIKTINGESLLGSGDIEIDPSPEIDEITITKNSTDKLQAVGVVNQNAGGALKSWSGTRAQYDAIETKDANTLYNIVDDTNVNLSILEVLYPVGAIYIGTMATCPLEVLGVGTWALKSTGRVLQGADEDHEPGETIEAGLPNITGRFGGEGYAYIQTTGSFSAGETASNYGTSHTSTAGAPYIYFDASRSNPIYSDDIDTVQAPAYVVNIFERIS